MPDTNRVQIQASLGSLDPSFSIANVKQTWQDPKGKEGNYLNKEMGTKHLPPSCQPRFFEQLFESSLLIDSPTSSAMEKQHNRPVI